MRGRGAFKDSRPKKGQSTLGRGGVSRGRDLVGAWRSRHGERGGTSRGQGAVGTGRGAGPRVGGARRARRARRSLGFGQAAACGCRAVVQKREAEAWAQPGAAARPEPPGAPAPADLRGGLRFGPPPHAGPRLHAGGPGPRSHGELARPASPPHPPTPGWPEDAGQPSLLSPFFPQPRPRPPPARRSPPSGSESL